MDTINICYIADKNYIVPTITSITSVLANTTREVKIWILTTDKDEFPHEVSEIKNVEILNVDWSTLMELNGIKGVVCNAKPVSMLKFQIPRLLSSLDKVLYLDGDTVVQSDIGELFDTDIDNYYLAAVLDTGDAKALSYRIGVNSNKYFNSGVMLMNLHKMREQKLAEALIHYRSTGKNYFQDQDSFNCVCLDHVKYLDNKYNFLSSMIRRNSLAEINCLLNEQHTSIDELLDGQVILHLTDIKPWKCETPFFSRRFMKYYENSVLGKKSLCIEHPIQMEKNSRKKSNSSQVFRKLALLGSYHISFPNVLKMMNIKSTYIYGFGEIGQILYRYIKDEIKIEGIIDKGKSKEKKTHEGIDIISPEEIPDNNVAIIVTPSAYVVDIISQLLQRGIQKERLWSFNVLLDIALKYGTNIHDKIDFSKQFLITGANFENKGAQAMLFTAVSEIRKRYPKAIIWYMVNGNIKIYTEDVKQRYNMLFLMGGLNPDSQVYESMHNITAMVDVSGYTLASHFKNSKIIPIMQIAFEYNIPLYFMPQSFGPLDFKEEVHVVLRELLPTAKVIFAREKQGYDEMKEKYHLQNIYLSKDLVLQNEELDLESIYTEVPDLSKYDIGVENAVAIIPNTQTYVFGNKLKVLNMYKEIIDLLLSLGKKVYIVGHSDDQEVSEDIYAMYTDSEDVLLYDQEFDCIGYSTLVRNFQYIIASRYHAIVHALKEGTPCIAIGWAEKYIELMNGFEQKEYVFDVRNEMNVKAIVDAVAMMDKSFENTSMRIKELLPKFQAENCFDVLSGLNKEE